ncbi:hypothetical protein AVEN_173835-1 [Araneus ventricosus]|uniref:Uncharacterized protein n=1 Tax=Araneus ventricosus TaxID=182803 RepID=A0A4Y2QCN3_ARAVE|nr:hypothetical protein AVEN_173835-1 [Araneus ventricosus]
MFPYLKPFKRPKRLDGHRTSLCRQNAAPCPMPDAITAPVPVEWTRDSLCRQNAAPCPRVDRTPPHVPVPEAITATEPFGWTWDKPM